MDQHIRTSITKTTLTVAASGTGYSVPVDAANIAGIFSVQLVITGSGTLTLGYELSNTEEAPFTWSTPVGASTIATGLTAGTYMYKVEPYCLGKRIRLYFTETGTSDSASIVSNFASL